VWYSEQSMRGVPFTKRGTPWGTPQVVTFQYINTTKGCVLPNVGLKNDFFQFTTLSSTTLVFISYTKFFSINSHHVPTYSITWYLFSHVGAPNLGNRFWKRILRIRICCKKHFEEVQNLHLYVVNKCHGCIILITTK
jgi:hypothetical protein